MTPTIHEQATNAQLSRDGQHALVEIGRLADRYAIGAITAVHFTRRVGLFLSEAEARKP